MKKLILAVILSLASTSAWGYTYASFQPYSSAAATCAVVKGTIMGGGVFVPDITSTKTLAFTRGRTRPYQNYSTSTSGHDAMYVKCVQDPAVANVWVKVFFEGSSTKMFPVYDSFVFGIRK